MDWSGPDRRHGNTNASARAEAFLTRLFEQPGFRAGTSGPQVIRSLRMLGSDVAVMASSEVTRNQKVSDSGQTVPALHTNELSVLRRQGEHWVIVSDLSCDESHSI